VVEYNIPMVLSLTTQLRAPARVRRALARAAGRARHAGAAGAAALALALALLEPVLCIVHCSLWLPAAYGAHHAAGHHHPGPHAGHAAHAAAAEDARAAEPSPDAACHLRPAGAASDAPYHVPPSPVREALPVLIATLLAPLAGLWLQAARCLWPPPVFIGSPLRPPLARA
jgi:hypothetical protein